MRRTFASSLLAMLFASPSAAPAQVDSDAPAVLFRFEPAYQSVLDTETGDAVDDARWAERRAEPLTDLFASDGTRLLDALADYAGVPWPYEEIPVYGVRRLSTLSIQYPLTLAVGEIRQGESRQEIPEGDFLVLTLVHQLTHYLLDPPPPALGAERPDALEHPLMEEGNYRREAVVNVVAYRALEDLWGRERLRRATADPLWASYNPSAALVDTLRARWAVSRSRPLVTWLLQESPTGELVQRAERLEEARGEVRTDDVAVGDEPSGTASGSDVGLDLGQTAQGLLFIAFLDPRSPAEAAGLRPGDIVVTVEGRRMTEPREAMVVVRDAWERNREVNLSVERQGKEIFFQIH